jgi:hypothetical protein
MKLKSGTLVKLTIKKSGADAFALLNKQSQNIDDALFIYLGSTPSKKMINNDRRLRDKLALCHWLFGSHGVIRVNACNVCIHAHLHVTQKRLKACRR